MATIENKARRRKGRRGMADGRRYNRGVLGNSGGKAGRSGRKRWKPYRRLIAADAGLPTSKFVLQSDNAAWREARSIVRRMVAIGVPLEAVGRFLTPPIASEATLRRHFALEIDTSRWEANLQVTTVAFRMATSGRHERMTWWWLERRVAGFHTT